jgi:hypothetical protein
MPFIAKTGPIAASVGDTVRIEERPDVWWQGGRFPGFGFPVGLGEGGRGLWARGIVLSASPAGSKQRIEVRIGQLITTGQFGLDQIAPHRDSTATAPIVGLARKLYRHTHNKISGLTNAEADLLLQYFE